MIGFSAYATILHLFKIIPLLEFMNGDGKNSSVSSLLFQLVTALGAISISHRFGAISISHHTIGAISISHRFGAISISHHTIGAFLPWDGD